MGLSIRLGISQLSRQNPVDIIEPQYHSSIKVRWEKKLKSLADSYVDGWALGCEEGSAVVGDEEGCPEGLTLGTWEALNTSAILA
jgi:hypothetical protein